MSCQTCYSTLVTGSTPYWTPCCQTPICDRCIVRNPRLQEYNPCLRCGDVRTADGLGRIERGRAETSRRRRETQEGRFVLEDSDDDEDSPDIDSMMRPPSYRSNSSESSTRATAQPPSPCISAVAPDPDHARGASGPSGSGKTSHSEDLELVEIKHPVSRSDTVLSVARRYGADPHDLLSLNGLPPTAISSNPRILQTRRVIIISRRFVKKGSQPDALVFDAGQSMPVDPEEEARREEERRVKRFQLITKTVDPGIGRAYLALEGEGDAERHPLEDGSGEAMPGYEDSLGESGKKLQPRRKEDRALGAFYEDEAWESEVGGPERVKVDGRWTVVGSIIGLSKA